MDRQVPGHWAGELINGEGNAITVATLVERSRRVLMLVKLPHPKPATIAHVPQVSSDKLNSGAQPLLVSMTFNQGLEMAMHAKLTAQTGVAMHFCDPHSLRQQRGPPWPGAPVSAHARFINRSKKYALRRKINSHSAQ